MRVSLTGASQNKIKNPYLLWPTAVHAHIKGRIWFKFCEYLSQPHPPTLCTLAEKAYAHRVQKSDTCTGIQTLITACCTYDVSHISTNMQITNAQTAKGADAKRASPWAVWELFWDLSSPPWVFCLSREGCSLLCGGRFSTRINEKLHLSHEKSIFTIYLTSCIPKAHIRHCWLMLAYSSVSWCIHCHCCDLLWVGCPPSSRAHWVSCISHVHCQKTHSSVPRWNIARNWKSEEVIEEMRVIKLPRTLVFFLDNVFYFPSGNGWLSTETEDWVAQSGVLPNLARPL